MKKIRKTIMGLLILGVFMLSFVSVSAANSVNDSVNAANEISIVRLAASQDLAEATIKEKVPATYELAEKQIESKNLKQRFLMWTNDGQHIMWGTLGRGYFVGQDNLGTKSWGIYSNHIFAGFYAGEFFVGKYRFGSWKAENLFGEESSQGRYLVFPRI